MQRRKVKGGEREVRRTEEGSGSKGEWWGMRGRWKAVGGKMKEREDKRRGGRGEV